MWETFKRSGMVSMPSREALRTNKQLYLTRFQEYAIQHRPFCKDPRRYEYTPGYVLVDAGNEIYLEVLKIIEQHCPWQLDPVKRLTDTKKCDLLEGVLGFWRADGRWLFLDELECLICEVNRRQNGIPAQSRIGPPPAEGYDFKKHPKFKPPVKGSANEQIDQVILDQMDWDLEDATYFREGEGLRNFASLEPWAHEQLDMLNFVPGMEHDFGPYYTSDQITIFYKACLDRGLCINALQLSEPAYQGDLVETKRSLRVWMLKTVAKDVKVEESASVPAGAAPADAAVPQTGAAAGGGGSPPKAEPSAAGQPATAKESEPKIEMPKPPPLLWRAMPADLQKLEWQKGESLQ